MDWSAQCGGFKDSGKPCTVDNGKTANAILLDKTGFLIRSGGSRILENPVQWTMAKR